MELDSLNETLNKVTCVSKLTVKENQQERSVFVKFIWKDNVTDLFHINIFDGQDCWGGRFSRQFAKEFIKETEETEDMYYENVQKVTTEGLFTYEFTTLPEDSAKFSWKKHYGKPNISLLHGAVPVHKIKDNTKDTLIEFLINQNKNQMTEITQLNNKVETISQELGTCKSDLENFVSSKITIEQLLYEKFANLLNSKKRRIAVLEESLSHLTESNNYD